jgi:hypothetical protein
LAASIINYRLNLAITHTATPITSKTRKKAHHIPALKMVSTTEQEESKKEQRKRKRMPDFMGFIYKV